MISLGQLLINRLERAGANVPEFNLASDLLAIAAGEADGWIHRPEDAVRIPDVLAEAATALRNHAREL